MSALTRQQVIDRALAEIGLIAEGESASGAMFDRALERLLAMTDQWNAQGLIPPVDARTTLAWAGSLASATVGDADGADKVGPRLRHLTSAAFMLSGQTQELPLDLLTRERYEAEPDKAQTMTLPRKAYVRRTEPNWTLALFPIPTEAITLVLYTKTVLAAWADGTTYTLAEGYEEAFVMNLARRCCRVFGRPVTEDLDRDAKDAFAIIKMANDQVPELECDPALAAFPGVFDINTGDFLN